MLNNDETNWVDKWFDSKGVPETKREPRTTHRDRGGDQVEPVSLQKPQEEITCPKRAVLLIYREVENKKLPKPKCLGEAVLAFERLRKPILKGEWFSKKGVARTLNEDIKAGLEDETAKQLAGMLENQSENGMTAMLACSLGVRSVRELHALCSTASPLIAACCVFLEGFFNEVLEIAQGTGNTERTIEKRITRSASAAAAASFDADLLAVVNKKEAAPKSNKSAADSELKSKKKKKKKKSKRGKK